MEAAVRPPSVHGLRPSEDASSALSEDVHACDVEMLRGLQHVAVVRVDLLYAMFLGAGQVERVTRSEEDRARKVEDGFPGLLQKLGRHTKPLRSEEHTSELQSHHDLVCRLLLEKKKKIQP